MLFGRTLRGRTNWNVLENMMGGATPLGSSGLTLVNPRSAGEVVSAGIAIKVATRFEPKMNSLMTWGLKIWVQVTAPC